MLPDSIFGDYNPFKLNVYGGWLNYGEWHHRGAVYLDGEALSERQSIDEVRSTPRTWFTASAEGKTIVWANFGDADPNTSLSEINVRECVFFPEKPGLGYIAARRVDVYALRGELGPAGIAPEGDRRRQLGQGVDHRELQGLPMPSASASPLGTSRAYPYRNADIDSPSATIWSATT